MPAAAGPAERSAAPGVPRTTDEEDSRPNAASFPIVGIGASAGGLEAFTKSWPPCLRTPAWHLFSSSIWTLITLAC